MQPRRIEVGLALLSVTLGALIGYGDYYASEVQGSVLLLLLFPFGLALTEPRGAWRWGLLVGLGVPCAHLLGLALRLPPPYPVQPNVLATFLALIPALLGAGIGALVGNNCFVSRA